ncbi:hypothetical protein KCU90_g15790, partial [Aureobasidium melanogenum]
PYLTEVQYANLGPNIFWIWGGFCWIAVVFVWSFIYETKDLSLEEVNELYNTVGKAWKSKSYRPMIAQSNGDWDAARSKAEAEGKTSHAQSDEMLEKA